MLFIAVYIFNGEQHLDTMTKKKNFLLLRKRGYFVFLYFVWQLRYKLKIDTQNTFDNVIKLH